MNIEILTSSIFDHWLFRLKDRQAKRRIQMRIDRMEEGNFGDVQPVGEGISELRIHCGAGYRVYFIQRDKRIVILLCGGDKSTQQKDIIKAKLIANMWEF